MKKSSKHVGVYITQTDCCDLYCYDTIVHLLVIINIKKKLKKTDSEMFTAVTQATLHGRCATKLYCNCVSVNL